jgi:hypothetical protein
VLGIRIGFSAVPYPDPKSQVNADPDFVADPDSVPDPDRVI